MAISLPKGGNANLAPAQSALSVVRVHVDWDRDALNAAAWDLDIAAFLLGSDGKIQQITDAVFYAHTTSGCGSVAYARQAGTRHPECLLADLPKVPASVAKIAITLTIHDAQSRGQSFQQVKGAHVRVCNAATGADLVRYDLATPDTAETALILGELYRHSSGWKFRAVGQGFKDGLPAMCAQFGLALD